MSFKVFTRQEMLREHPLPFFSLLNYYGKMRIFTFIIASVIVLCSLSGCVAVLFGTGIAGGVVLSEDTVEFMYHTDLLQAWDISYAALGRIGSIKFADKINAEIKTDIAGSAVTVKIMPTSMQSVVFHITARKNIFPDIKRAIAVMRTIEEALRMQEQDVATQ